MSNNPWSVVAVRESAAIPQNNPSIKNIIRVTTTPIIHKTVAIEKKVVIWGGLDVGLEYVAAGNTTHFALLKLPYCHYISHRKATPEFEPCLQCEVEFHSVEPLDGRAVLVYAIIRIKVTGLARKACLALPATIETLQQSLPSPTEPPIAHNPPALIIRRPSGWNPWTRRFRR